MQPERFLARWSFLISTLQQAMDLPVPHGDLGVICALFFFPPSSFRMAAQQALQTSYPGKSSWNISSRDHLDLRSKYSHPGSVITIPMAILISELRLLNPPSPYLSIFLGSIEAREASNRALSTAISGYRTSVAVLCFMGVVRNFFKGFGCMSMPCRLAGLIYELGREA